MKLNKCTIKTHVRSDISDLLIRFQRGWLDMSESAGHVRISEGIDLPIYRPIYWLGRLIFDRFRSVFTRRHRFLGRSTRRRVPRSIPSRIQPLFTPPPQFSLAAYPPSHPARFIGSDANYRSILGGFRPVAVDFGPPRPASAPLLTGANEERKIHSVAELERPNTIYMSSGSSRPIFTFFI
jgi:hypothetical protein